MASYHFHFQQQDEGPREDVRTPATSVVPFVSPYVAVPYSDASLQVSLQGPQGPAVIDSTPDLEALQQVAAAADDDGELEDLAPLPLGPVVEVQDPAALPQDPELLWLHVLRQRRCHLSQCILRILSILLCLVRHHLVLLLCLEQQLQRRNHHRLCLLRCHRATHDHKSFHLKPRLFTFVH